MGVHSVDQKKIEDGVCELSTKGSWRQSICIHYTVHVEVKSVKLIVKGDQRLIVRIFGADDGTITLLAKERRKLSIILRNKSAGDEKLVLFIKKGCSWRFGVSTKGAYIRSTCTVNQGGA